jgi:phosphoglycolate phosphatase-like HAD superfamily hydrolase
VCAAQIVTDIDNTILNSEPRLRRTLQELGLEELLPELLARYDGVKALLKPEEQEKFYQLFLSERYLHLDEPLPGAAEALRALREAGYRIVYLTGRHDAPGDSMRRGTELWLVEHGFPHPGDGSTLLRMKPRRGMDDRQFKEEALRELAKLGSLHAGIGDRPSDIEAYLHYGIPAILIRGDDRHPGDGVRAVAGGVEVVRDWSELEALLLRSG